MDITNTLTCADRDAWRSWLCAHHDKESEIWLVFFKKHTGIASVSYDEAVQEALCFGWIDGIAKTVDEKKYAQRFTPRRKGSSWSASNIARMRRLINDGRMTDAGLRVFDTALFDRPLPIHPGKNEQEVPAWILEAFQANAVAWSNFNALPPSQRRLYVGWILFAKKDETRRRRLAKAMQQLELNERLGMK